MPDQDPIVRSLNEAALQQRATHERTALRRLGVAVAVAVIGAAGAAFVAWRRRKPEPLAEQS